MATEGVSALVALIVVLEPDGVVVTPGDDGQLTEGVHGLLGPTLPDGAVSLPVAGQKIRRVH